MGQYVLNDDQDTAAPPTVQEHIMSKAKERKEKHFMAILLLDFMLLLPYSIIMHATGTRQVIYTVEYFAQLPQIFWLVQLLF